MELDYNTEVNNLQLPRNWNWWNPKEGKYRIHVVKIGDVVSVDFKGKTREKRCFDITVNNEAFNWSVSVIKTTASVYGQLMRAGKNLGGLEGKDLDVIIQGEGKSRRYTIEQGLPPKTEDVTPVNT